MIRSWTRCNLAASAGNTTRGVDLFTLLYSQKICCPVLGAPRNSITGANPTSIPSRITSPPTQP